MSPTARSVVIPLVLFGMYAAFGAAWLGVVPLFKEISAALAVDVPSAARLVGIVSLAKSVIPIVAGVVAARVGLTATMRAAAVLMALAIAIPFLPAFPLWIAGRFLFGVGGAIWLALMGAVVVDAVGPRARPVVNALNGVAVNTGAIVGLTFALPLSASLGFDKTLALFGAAIAVFGALLLAVGPLSSTKPPAVPVSTVLKSYGSVLREPSTWLVALAFTGPLALYLVVNTWLPTHLEEAFAMQRSAAASWLVYMNVWGIPASLGVGFLLFHKIGPPRLHMLVGALLLPVGMWLALRAGDDDGRRLWLAVAGVGMFWPVAPLVTALQRMPGMTAARVGMVMGTMGSVTYVVSSFAPDVVGAAVTAGAPAITALLPCCALGLTPVVALLLPSDRDGR
jgi:cyanate permease